MTQYNLKNNQLKLSVKKSPFIIRYLLFLIAFMTFTLPILGMIGSVVTGNGFDFGFLIGIGLFSLLAFYLFRIALWNTYGEEIILFSKNEIIYEANYGWFRDAKKTIENQNINYDFSKVGYEEDNEAVLILNNGKEAIECAVKMKQVQIEELILILSTKN
ncbi:hypothetical protein GKZ90_0020590 [Flavobacterium sp. MC2016-06]|jgi:hypothetical protein|uniref:hypothetical protein n=1 Tax=Flavobacterium sp. MC2016-06 TaxID=2676308 RepID=UPI0012BADC54|nr:hypothetical protein [Flavobacterium sp. MC2016-06]MBU3860832.1 hypothetical protein [Flavobacterium sp. MC2016-06]